mgnify:CR=1 FL=1
MAEEEKILMMRKSGLGKFLAGAAIGVGLGILFAPKSGAETRKEKKEKIDDLVVKVKELDVKEVRDYGHLIRGEEETENVFYVFISLKTPEKI